MRTSNKLLTLASALLFTTLSAQAKVQNTPDWDNSARAAFQPNFEQQHRKVVYIKPKKITYVQVRPAHQPRKVYVYSPTRQFYRGAYLPVAYRGPAVQRYVVVNWRQHPVYAPPRGTHWVYVDGRYVLAAIATGLIYNVIYAS